VKSHLALPPPKMDDDWDEEEDDRPRIPGLGPKLFPTAGDKKKNVTSG